jgi:integrase family protein with SAM-like domain
MASVHKDPRGRSPYYYAAFTSNGRRLFYSTKEKNRKKAERVAIEWEKAAELAEKGELTEAASRKVLDAIRATVGDSALPTVTVRGFLKNWLDRKTLSQKASTGQRYEKPVTEFLKSLGEKADKSLGHLTPSDIQNFQDTRTSMGVSLSTVSFDMQVIRSALKVATDQELVATKRKRATNGETNGDAPSRRAILRRWRPMWRAFLNKYPSNHREEVRVIVMEHLSAL